MSYAKFDHAEWVQRQIAPSKKTSSRKRAGDQQGWQAAPDVLAPFHAKVFDILGMTFGGIYNARISWDALDWHCGHGLAVPMRSQELSTFDFHEMTSLVFLCHEARIRCAVSSHGVGGILLRFSPYEGMGVRHPNLDEAVARFRGFLPKDHRIVYREPERAAVDPCEDTA